MRIRDLARELKLDIRLIALVVSRVRDGLSPNLRALAEEANLEIAGAIPEDSLISRLDEEGKPIISLPDDSPARLAVEEIVGSYLKRGVRRGL